MVWAYREIMTSSKTASWADFRAEAPDLADRAEASFAKTGLVLVGSLRANGWPRISPTEPLVVDDWLYLGMMWQSRKALDLLRDPRTLVHTAISDKNGTAEGDVKLYGNSVDVTDADERERFTAALKAHIGWAPDGDFHLFRLHLTEVGAARVEDEKMVTWAWKPGTPPRRAIAEC